MFFFEKLLHAQLHWPAYLLLGLAVWSIYTLDHLLDVRGKYLPLSPRRAFHLAYWKTLGISLGIAVLLGMIGAFWWFGWGKELQLTLCLVLLILGSKLLIRRAGPGWMKELSIAMFYVVGIVWLPLLRANGLDLLWQDLVFLPAYIGLAFLNLLMLSFLDQDEDQQAGFFSAAWTLSPLLLIQSIRNLAFALIFISLAGFVLLSSFYRPFACVLLLMALIHYLTFFHSGLSPEQKRMRMEISFVLPSLLLFL
ncbi:hypothetical protein B0E43_20260 [Algoriphagus sp. A40]|nr:hypothetical protein B0E43_20260 [Algoriphagus sp. A40]